MLKIAQCYQKKKTNVPSCGGFHTLLMPSPLTLCPGPHLFSWPFGRSLRERALPTTLEELDRLREEQAVEKSTQRLYASNV